ncbi:MAG: Ldh family oxidoreductase, partial [Chloroflexi bacterium]|nr:Ldh family oxidoreductase [Chloroflexota bacterium]
CGALSGFGTSAVIASGTAAHCFGALRIDAFGSLDDYLRRTGELIDRVKESAKRDGVAEITIAGELEHRLAEERRAAGAVPLHPAIVDGFRDAAEELHVPFDLLEEV